MIDGKDEGKKTKKKFIVEVEVEKKIRINSLIVKYEYIQI
jgi:hypothetical protein